MASPPPPLRFETFGSVERVLHDIEASLPHIFPEHAREYIVYLKKMVREASQQQGWDSVVLRVSRGMAEEELEDLSWPGGPVMITPALCTAHPQSYKGPEEVKSDAGRLAALAESGDLIAVLYGAGGMDRKKRLQLAQARLRAMDMSFEMLMREFGDRPIGEINQFQAGVEEKRLQAARNFLSDLRARIDLERGAEARPDAEAGVALASALQELQFLLSHDLSPEFRHLIYALDLQLQNIPVQFPELGILPPQLEADPEPAPRLRPQTAPAPHHNLFYDEMNPKPGID